MSQLRYYIYSFTSNLVFYTPILLIYFESRSISAEQIYYLIALYTLTSGLAEFPSSVIADSISLRLTLIISLVFLALGALLFMGSYNFIGLAVSQALVALGISLRSGTDSAYLYQLCRNPDTYSQAESRATSINQLALAISGIVGGYLFTIAAHVPFLFTALCMLASLFSLIPFGTKGKDPPLSSNSRLSIRDVIAQAFQTVNSDRKLLYLLIYFSSIMTISSISFWSVQLYLKEINVPITYFGMIYTGLFAMSSLSAGIANNINKHFGHKSVMFLASITLCVSLIMMGFVHSIYGIALPFAAQFVRGYLLPSLKSILQNWGNFTTRATLLSFESMIHRIMFIIGTLAFGKMSGTYSLNFAFQVAGIIGLCILLPTTLYVVFYSEPRKHHPP